MLREAHKRLVAIVTGICVAILAGCNTGLHDSGGRTFSHNVNTEALAKWRFEGGPLPSMDSIKNLEAWVRQHEDDAVAMYWLGEIYDRADRENLMNKAEALRLFERSAELGHGPACIALARKYNDGNVESEDYGKALKWLLKGALAGDRDCMNRLGNVYLMGRGVLRDRPEAFKWFEQAAMQGDPAGMCNLGRMYLMGWGTRRDPDMAVKWFKKSANAGSFTAMASLGDCYRRKGGLQNYVKAREWFIKAAGGGNKRGMSRLGVMYLSGLGGEKDSAKAQYWILRAAESGDDVAMYNIAVMYLYGEGIKQDDGEAEKWFRRIIENKSIESPKALKGLEEIWRRRRSSQ